MQGFNKYYPPDYDPSEGSLNKRLGKHALGDRARKIDQGILVVRFELPYNIWCGHCNAHIGQGVRYNAEKKKVGMYYSTTIWSFRCKCHLCQHWFEIRTDPENTRYVVHEGARQKYEEWDPEENGQMVIDNSTSTSTAPPDPFASLEKNLTQKSKALSESARLSAMYERNASNWEDPYYASSLLRNSFRKKKRKILESEDKAEKVREKFGLGERVGVESLRTPARKEDREEEERAWRDVQKERGVVEAEKRRKREREEEQVGWSSAKAKGKEKESSTRPRHSSSSSSRPIKPLPSRSTTNRPRSSSTSSLSKSTSSNPSPALKALHSKLSLASALKNDPFNGSTGTPSKVKVGGGGNRSSPALGGGVKLVKKVSK